MTKTIHYPWENRFVLQLYGVVLPHLFLATTFQNRLA